MIKFINLIIQHIFFKIITLIALQCPLNVHKLISLDKRMTHEKIQRYNVLIDVYIFLFYLK